MVPSMSTPTAGNHVGEPNAEVRRLFDTSEDEPFRCMEIFFSSTILNQGRTEQRGTDVTSRAKCSRILVTASDGTRQ